MSAILLGISNVFIFIARLVLPVLVVLLIFTCAKRMLKKSPKIPLARIALLDMPNVFDVTSKECSIGRSRVCDIRLNIPSVSRRHAVLSYSRDYGFKIYSVNSSKIYVNGIEVDEFAYTQKGDEIEIGGVAFELIAPEFTDLSSVSQSKRKKGALAQLVLLTIIEVIMAFELMIHYVDNFQVNIPIAFGSLILVEWVYYFFSKSRDSFQIELIGFLLTAFGFAVASSSLPSSLIKQLITFALGVAVFIVSNILQKHIELTMKMRYALAVLTVLAFAFNLVFGKNINGAKNWIAIGSFTVQPSELLKYSFVFVGASTLDRLLAKRNVLLFLLFSGICLGSLAIMKDFGTASIYFVTMLVIMFMRSGDLKIITAACAGVGVAAIAVATFVPYVQQRFATYRHAWEYASDKGYQQTRTMIACASGGLFGVGGANGNLDDVAAADTDLVFGMLCEEWGLIIAFALVLCFVLIAVYSWRKIPTTNSAFYAIAASAVSALFLFQISLNIFGSTDLLPLTGVTMPFISNGGSSMIASWALLSFIKSLSVNSQKPQYEFDEDEDCDEDEYYDDEDEFEDISSMSNKRAI